VGYPTGATEATGSFSASVPALALVDRQGDVVRVTETFREGFAPDGAPQFSIWDFVADDEQRLLLGRILEGRLLHVDLVLPGAAAVVAVGAEAVLDAAGMRYALLTVSSSGGSAHAELRPGKASLLDDPSLDESPAMVWIKDLGGRYLRVNRSYTERHGIDDASIRGKSDAELPPAQVVDRRRPQQHEGDDAEPVQLEYTVEAFGGRQALTVLRFPVRDSDGAPIAVCRVAAPAAEAGIARSEAERLLRAERWARLSPAAIRLELIDEWQLTEIGAPDRLESGLADPARAAELAQLRAELGEEREARARLEARLGEERVADVAGRSEVAALEAALEAERDRADRADLDLATARGRVEELEADLSTVASSATEADAERSLRAELEQRLAEALRRAAESEESVAAERAASAQARAELVARAERAEATADEARAAGERASAFGERTKAVAELSRARADGLETALTGARELEAESRAALAQARAEIAGLQEILATARAEAETARQAFRQAGVADAADAAELAALRDELGKERAARAEVDKQLRTARTGLEEAVAAARRQADELVADVAGRGELEALEAALEAERERGDRADCALAASRGRVEELEADRTAVASGAEEAAAERSLRAQLEERLAEALRRTVESDRSAVAERAAAAQAREELVARAERAEAAADEVRAAGERAAAFGERKKAAAELARARAEGLETALTGARASDAESRAALAQARAEIASLLDAVTGARAEAEIADHAVRAATARLERERTELERQRGEFERKSRELEHEATATRTAEPMPSRQSSPLVRIDPAASAEYSRPPGPAWSHQAQRAVTASLAAASEWRTGLKDTIRILGSEGGWDVVISWCPERRGTTMRCTAMWTSTSDQLGLFETATWQRRPSLTASAVGRAAASGVPSWIPDLGASHDGQLAAAASEGMRGALLVPIRNDGEGVGLLELLTRTPASPDPELLAAMESVALQLAHFELLLRRGAEPQWRVGRM